MPQRQALQRLDRRLCPIDSLLSEATLPPGKLLRHQRNLVWQLSELNRQTPVFHREGQHRQLQRMDTQSLCRSRFLTPISRHMALLRSPRVPLDRQLLVNLRPVRLNRILSLERLRRNRGRLLR